MALELNKTDSHFKFIELSEGIQISNVPFVAGQYLITADGKAYYDPSTGTEVAHRIELSPDLTNFVTKTAGAGMIEDFRIENEPEHLRYSFQLNYRDSSTGQKGSITRYIDYDTSVNEEAEALVTSGAVSKPNYSAPRSAAITTSRPVISFPSVSITTFERSPFIISVW